MGHSIVQCIFLNAPVYQIRKNLLICMSVSVCKMVCILYKLKLLAAQRERGMVKGDV